jgi:hypothetical protein
MVGQALLLYDPSTLFTNLPFEHRVSDILRHEDGRVGIKGPSVGMDTTALLTMLVQLLIILMKDKQKQSMDNLVRVQMKVPAQT